MGIGGSVHTAGHISVQGQPVAVVETALPQAFTAVSVILALHVIHPSLHAVVLPLQDAFIAVMQVHIPGNHGGSLAPGSGSVAGIIGHRNHIGHTAAQLLLLPIDVPSVFRIKCISIHVEAGRTAEDLGISRPAVSLVPLGAVRRHVQEIALLSPFCIVNQLVHQRIRGLDISQFLHLGVDDQPSEIIHIRLAFPTGDLDEPIAVKGKMLPHIARISVRNVCKFCLCRPQIFIVKISVLEDFTKLETKLRAL